MATPGIMLLFSLFSDFRKKGSSLPEVDLLRILYYNIR